MNKPLRIICVLLVMVAVITVAGFSACDSDSSPTDTTADPNSITETDENAFGSESTTNTNPNDDGFGTEVEM